VVRQASNYCWRAGNISDLLGVVGGEIVAEVGTMAHFDMIGHSILRQVVVDTDSRNILRCSADPGVIEADHDRDRAVYLHCSSAELFLRAIDVPSLSSSSCFSANRSKELEFSQGIYQHPEGTVGD
jgi:hypothetical protein